MTTLAIFTKNLNNPAYAAARMGADRTAQRLGARTVHYVPQKPDNAEEQIALIARALAERPDAVVLVPVHPTAINGALRKIADAGVPLFGMLNEFTEAGPVAWVGADDYAIGREMGTYLCKHLGGRGRVVILEGAPHSSTSVARVRGFRDAAGESGIEIVSTICGDYLRAPARVVSEKLLASQIKFDAVFAANDDMALGMIAALDAAGLQKTVVGVNAIPEAIALIKSGKLLATADFNAMQISALATEAATRHLRGEKVPGRIILPVTIVDRRNCGDWDKPFEQRTLVRWEKAVSA